MQPHVPVFLQTQCLPDPPNSVLAVAQAATLEAPHVVAVHLDVRGVDACTVCRVLGVFGCTVPCAVRRVSF